MPFSVILSIYYKESPLFLRESLDSLFSQTVCPDEVILVKDGPIGDELDNVIDSYVTRYPYLKVLSLVTNRGLGKALDEGLLLHFVGKEATFWINGEFSHSDI